MFLGSAWKENHSFLWELQWKGKAPQGFRGLKGHKAANKMQTETKEKKGWVGKKK